jgi:hypothetical protein
MDVAVDSQIMSFLIKKKPPAANNKTQNIAEMYKRSRWLISALERNGDKICLPTVVVSELLIGVDVKQHTLFIAELQSRCTLLPYDRR